MSDQPAGRFRVVVEEGPPHGGLYELEQTTYYHVLDTHSGDVIMTFSGEMVAGLSQDTGMWEDYSYSGVREVAIAPGEESVLVTDSEGCTEVMPLPR